LILCGKLIAAAWLRETSVNAFGRHLISLQRGLASETWA
jgi:hypothetical protein